MDAFLTQWLVLVTVSVVAAMSPGPDFVMVLKNALAYGRRTGIVTAIGIGLGAAVHVTYILAGLAAVIAHSGVLFTTLKFVGAAYLFYVGVQALRSTGWHVPHGLRHVTQPEKSDRAALLMGFWTNVLNPKATLFFLAVFAQVLKPDMTLIQQAIFGLTPIVIVTTWFIGVSIFMTTPQVRAVFVRLSKWVDRVCGVLFIALGVKLLMAKIAA